GEGKSEPEWNNDIYLSAWTSDPKDAAHRLSQGYADYDEAEVDRKLSEKQTAIAANNLGWPLCATFNSPQCQTCPMFQLGKSPLHFVPRTAQAEPVQPKPEADDLFPEGYWRNVHDHVFTNGRFGPFDVFSGYPVHNGWVDSETGELVLLTSIGGSERYGNINVSKQASGPMCEALTRGTKNGIIIHNNQKDVKDCVMALVINLPTRQRTIPPQSFGWSNNNFVFGDYSYTPDGPELVYRGSSIDPKYDRVGELEPWTNAMELVYGSPQLEAVVASAFASPRVALMCDYSLVL